MNTFTNGIVLSGGGARGLAHLGVLKALEEHDIFPDIVSGVSAGAIAGALYCDGMSVDDIREIFMQHKLFNYARFAFPTKGLGSISGLKKIIRAALKAKRFEELKKPLYITVTDLNNARPVYYARGDLLEAVIASSSIPVIFNPVIKNNIHYVDGSVMNNLPVEPLIGKCERIIGVNVNPIDRKEGFGNILHIAERVIHLSVAAQRMAKHDDIDLLIEPAGLENYTIFEISKGQQMFDLGYQYTKSLLRNSIYNS